MITALLNGVPMPEIELDFIDAPIENATDVITLDGGIYTDFTNQKKEWTFNYESLTKAQYDIIRAVYDSQFSTGNYPTLAIAYYGFSGSVRMYINEKNIWNNCGDVQGVEIRFREAV
jgi:hypothetical protein